DRWLESPSRLAEFETTVPSETQLAILGQHIVLDCSFPVDKQWDQTRCQIEWMLDKEVVHSFYYGQDHLNDQSSRYVNRTSLHHSDIQKGDASLRLERATLEDEGNYTCTVHTEMGPKRTSVSLKLFSTSACGVELLLTTEGYPRPSVQWLTVSGEDVTDDTVTHLSQDTRGLYTVSSTVSLQGAVNKTLTFVLKNEEVGQEIRRNITFISGNLQRTRKYNYLYGRAFVVYH
uniref:CD276 antigen-like n=1 Tax=Salmo trutta TaxID=8032 RepID=A0A674C5C4_SALTR